MKSELLFLVLSLFAQDDTYRIKFWIKAENKGNEAQILKRSVADTDGIAAQSFDPNTETLTLTVRRDTLVTANQVKQSIALSYPRVAPLYHFEKTEILGLVGEAKNFKGTTVLVVEPMRARFILAKLNDKDETLSFIEKKMKESSTFRVSGLLEEGKGRLGKPVYTLKLTNVDTARAPESKKAEKCWVRVVIEGAKEEDKAKIEEGLERVSSVRSCTFDPESGVASCEVEAKSKLKAADFVKAIRRGTATKVQVDALDGKISKDKGEVRFKADNGQEFVLVPEGKFAEKEFEILERWLGSGNSLAVSVSGELVDEKERSVIKTRLLRASKPTED